MDSLELIGKDLKARCAIDSTHAPRLFRIDHGEFPSVVVESSGMTRQQISPDWG